MSREIELVREAITAAKESCKASYHALLAVERLLSPSPDEENPQPDDGSCKHDKAHTVTTTAGTFLICECGHQGASAT